jgi:hypothetical protein
MANEVGNDQLFLMEDFKDDPVIPDPELIKPCQLPVQWLKPNVRYVSRQPT